MRFFRKRKSVEDLAAEVRELVEQRQRGTLSEQEFADKAAKPQGEIVVNLLTLRFGADEIDKLLNYGNSLSGDAQLSFLIAVQSSFDVAGERDPLVKYAIGVVYEKMIDAVIWQSMGLQKEENWAESLHCCQIAEQYLADTDPMNQPFYFYQVGQAYRGLGRLKEAYDAFIEGEKAAKKVLGSTENRDMQSLADDCHEQAEKLRRQI